MRKPGGSFTRFRLALMASALAPPCGTGAMLRSVPETLNCFSFSRFWAWAETVGAKATAAANASTPQSCGARTLMFSSGGLFLLTAAPSYAARLGLQTRTKALLRLDARLVEKLAIAGELRARGLRE